MADEPMIDEDHLFEGDSDFGGMIRGDATLAPGARLRMRAGEGGHHRLAAPGWR
jgi:hypothetical protein